MRDPLAAGHDVLGLERERESQQGAVYAGSEPVSSSKPNPDLPAGFVEAMGKGRRKGQVNRLTRTMKEAIEQAFEKAGGVDYLVRLAEGTATDRQAFAALIGRLLPLQVNSNIDQRIRIELPWLQARGIGKVDSAEAGALALVGKGRTIDNAPTGAEANDENM